MMYNIYEINILLRAINNLSNTKTGANRTNTIREVSTISIYAEQIDSENLIQESKLLRLIEEIKTRLLLTDQGHKFVDLQTIKDKIPNIDANEKQKEYFLNLIFDIDSYQMELKNILKNFRIDHKNKVWFYPSEYPKATWNKKLVNYLFEIDFWTAKDDRLEIKQQKSFFISKSRNKITRTEAELYKILEDQRKTGNIAEELTINYEKTRLKNNGHEMLSLIIQQISKNDVFAGYDILSFEGKRSSLKHDRMIEVKGTKGNLPIFYWSKNEISVAKKLQDKYWIYIWTEISDENQGNLAYTIKNPYKELIIKKRANPIPVLYFTDLANYQDK